MPYAAEFSEYFKEGHEAKTYAIREHKTKGLMLPEVKSQEFIASIPLSVREAHANVMDSF
jgi:hypothetical protein